MRLRIGVGYDLHKLVEGRKLFIGGVEIPFSKGLLAHSDGDVLLHALCDAILGGCGQGDIGMHFPDTEKEYEGISGRELLKRTYDIISKRENPKILNIDTIVICDEPKILKYSEDIKGVISDILNMSPKDINIKAKTTEKTAEDVISAYAVVLMEVK